MQVANLNPAHFFRGIVDLADNFVFARHLKLDSKEAELLMLGKMGPHRTKHAKSQDSWFCVEGNSFVT